MPFSFATLAVRLFEVPLGSLLTVFAELSQPATVIDPAITPSMTTDWITSRTQDLIEFFTGDIPKSAEKQALPGAGR
jgi:hypothetical protein